MPLRPPRTGGGYEWPRTANERVWEWWTHLVGPWARAEGRNELEASKLALRVDRLTRDLESERKQRADERADLEWKLEESAGAGSASQAMLITLSDDKSRLLSEVHKLRAAKVDLEEMVHRQTLELAQGREEFDALNATRERASTERSTLQTRLSHANQNLQLARREAEAEAERLRGEVESASAGASEASERLREADLAHATARRQIGALEEERKTMLREMAALRAVRDERDSLMNDNDAVRRAAAVLSADKDALLAEMASLRESYRVAAEPTAAQRHRTPQSRHSPSPPPAPEPRPPAPESPRAEAPMVRAYVRAAFDAVDRLRTGSIESRDLRAALRRAGLAIDSDGAACVLEDLYDGQRLSLNEFAKLVADIEGMLEAAGQRPLDDEPPDAALHVHEPPPVDARSPARSSPRAAADMGGGGGSVLPAHLEEELANLTQSARPGR